MTEDQKYVIGWISDKLIYSSNKSPITEDGWTPYSLGLMLRGMLLQEEARRLSDVK